MIVTTGRHRSREFDTCRVNRLEHSHEVNAAGDFLDEERREAHRAEGFVDAEEVDLGLPDDAITDAEVHRNPADEPDEFFCRSVAADADEPTGDRPRWLQGPLEESRRVLEDVSCVE